MACQEYKILGSSIRYLRSILNNNIGFKACQSFRNIWNIWGRALKVSADASLRVTKVLKFEPTSSRWREADKRKLRKVPLYKGFNK